MKLADLKDYSVEPGRYVQWAPRVCGPATRASVGVSENERFHLDGLRDGHPGAMILVIDLDLPTEEAALADLVPTLLRRHDGLLCYFVHDGENYHRRIHTIDDVALSVVDQDGTNRPAAMFTEFVLARIEAACDPMEPIGHYFAAVLRPESTTVICAFDHAYVDARSLTVLAGDIVDSVQRKPLGPASSGLELVRAHTEILDVDADDPRLQGWHQFLNESDWRIPDFPLDLGVAPGMREPMRTVVATFVDAAGATELSERAHAHGARTISVILSCLGAAVYRAGGPTEMATVIPAGPQTDRSSVAWVVDNIPMHVACRGDLVDLVRTNADRLKSARPLAEIGLTPVYQTFGHRLRREREDVFMVSYVDYTRWYHARAGVEVCQLSADHDTDDAQWWVWRDDEGIHVRVRYPATEQADKVIDEVLRTTVELVDRLRTELADRTPQA